MPETPEPERNQVVRLLPSDEEPLFAEEALDALQDELDRTHVDLIVQQPTPQPLGRGFTFDWARGRLVKPFGSLGPLETRGNETLKNWCEKCLMTARGAHPIHPPGYGLVRREDLIGGSVMEPPADLEDRIRSALTFHPRIANVTDFEFEFERDEEWVSISLTVVTDRDEQLPLQRILVVP